MLSLNLFISLSRSISLAQSLSLSHSANERRRVRELGGTLKRESDPYPFERPRALTATVDDCTSKERAWATSLCLPRATLKIFQVFNFAQLIFSINFNLGAAAQVLDGLQACCARAGAGFIRIDGSVAPEERQRLVESFQRPGPQSPRVAVLSMTAAGQGITLTAASTVVFAELHWTPGVLVQVARAHVDMYF